MARSLPPIQLVVFDWAGTIIDFGSQAPVTAFQRVFSAEGVLVSDEETRAPMGLNKREHLEAMLRNPEVSQRWQAIKGEAWSEADVSRMYEDFIPFQLSAIGQHSQLVPHLAEVISAVRSHSVSIGTTTGYFRAASEAVLQAAEQQGFRPDAHVCADDVPQGRPAPWMIFEVMRRTKIYPVSSVVKVGDTTADIEAGLNAGCWTVGVCDSSSLTGRSYEALYKLPPEARNEQLSRTAAAFRDAGSHFTINSIDELPTTLNKINHHLSEGRRPY